jgi:hypothetical protein
VTVDMQVANERATDTCERLSYMAQKQLASFLVLTALLSGLVVAQEPPTPWRDDALFQRLSAALEPVRSVRPRSAAPEVCLA